MKTERLLWIVTGPEGDGKARLIHVNGWMGGAEYAPAWMEAVGAAARAAVAGLEDEAANDANMNLVLNAMGV